MLTAAVSFAAALFFHFPAIAAFTSIIGLIHLCVPPLLDLIGLVLDVVQGKKKSAEEMLSIRNSWTYQAVMYVLGLMSGKKP